MKEYKLDCIGEACPVPLIKAQKKMETMEVGDIVIINVEGICIDANMPSFLAYSVIQSL